MLSRCLLNFSVGVGAFVIGLSQISSFFLYKEDYLHIFKCISTCVHLPVGGHYLLFLALSIKVVLQGHLFVDHF